MALSTLAIVSIALAAAGTAASTTMQVRAGNAAEDAGKKQQEAENANAAAAANAAALEAGQIRRKNLLRLGSQRAAAASSGVLINDSAGDVIYDTSIQGELDALAATYSGATASSYYQSRGRNMRSAASNAATASYVGAGTSVIGGIGSGIKIAHDNPSF